MIDDARDALFCRAKDMGDKDLINADELPHFLRGLLHERLYHVDKPEGGFYAGDVAFELRMSLEEARTTGFFRERAVMLAESRIGTDKNIIKHFELAWEVMGTIEEKIGDGPMPEGGYYAEDVLAALRMPSFEELSERAERESNPQLPKWQRPRG